MKPLSQWRLNIDGSPGNQTNVTLTKAGITLPQDLPQALNRHIHRFLRETGNNTSIFSTVKLRL